ILMANYAVLIMDLKDKIVMDIFRGIPYAQPPIGEFRFQKPVPLNSWKGIREASEYGNVCMQDRIYTKEVWGDEDCLYLNIWIPNGVEGKLAVMIWFHGGAFALGASQGIDIMNSTLYDGYEIAHHGNVIVVTINYRLASLGFLSTGDENGRGNYGLWDQHMAIKWVKKNIANFGGNPGLITLFGESAGGASTSMHALSPVNKGLFRRVISESGDAQTMWAVNRRPLGAARRVAQAVGCPLEDKAAMMFCLRRVPAKDIVLAVRVTESLSNKEILFFLPFVPTIDGEFLPHEPVKLFENSKEIDYLLGCNSGDAHLFVSIWFPGVNIPFGISEHTVLICTAGSLGQAAVESVIFEYTDWKNPTEFSRRFGLVRMYTDMQIIITQPFFSTRHSSSTYAYLFAYPSRMPNLILPEWIGAIHAGELQFLFGKPFSNPKIYNQQERELSRAMINYWTNFIPNAHHFFQLAGIPGLLTFNFKLNFKEVTQRTAFHKDGVGEGVRSQAKSGMSKRSGHRRD
uniref:Carboxylic ester hydrolase n=1 Tax=Callorhinchus milii TaxID=7868 RepID=A0A4W3K8P9_CALMI